jgi:hypothetical protein
MKPVFGVFDQGAAPSIAVFDKSTVGLGDLSLAALVTAMQEYVDKCVAPVWGTPAKLLLTKGFKAKAWALVFLDDADAADALAYHELTPDGFPISKVFVRTINKARESLSVSASHELVEMLVDPAINLYTTGPDAKAMYAYESADPVEALSFPVKGLDMSDFVFPAWFEDFHKPRSRKFDWMGKVDKPFQLLSGGYQILWKNGRWTQIFGSKRKERAFAKEDRRRHRSEERAMAPSAWERSGRRRRRTIRPARLV